MKKLLAIVLLVPSMTGQIKPGKDIKATLQKKSVDLRECAWVEFKQVEFQARTSKTMGEVDVSIDRPGMATCVLMQ